MNNLKIIGTHHLMKESEIIDIIKKENPDIIGVELDQIRLDALTNPIEQVKNESLLGKIVEGLKQATEKQNMNYGQDMITASKYAIDNKIIVGSCSYQRLKHIVRDKSYARFTGYVNPKTRQPGKGRAKKGGLRLGYMERDALGGWGVTGVIKELFISHSDKYERYLSEKTKYFCIGNKYTHEYRDGSTDKKISKVYK